MADSDRTRVALITGAAGGIGSATVCLFRAEGWRVVAVDRRRDGPAADLQVQADVADPNALNASIKRAEAEYGRLDALVNNAAEQLCAPVVEMRVGDWDRIMAANVRAAYIAAAGAFPMLKASAGSIVNVSSIHAFATSVGMAAYASSKGALVALTRSLALEFGSAGVRVNAVLPGATDTPMLAAGLARAHLNDPAAGPASALDALAAKTPLRRIGKPEEIARVIYVLADSTWSSFVTGTTIVADGGAYARLSTE